MMKACLVLFLAISDVILCQTPIPNRPLGYILMNHPDPAVVVEIFYDYLCDDSMANWPIFNEIQEEYRGKPFKLLVHIFPLPNHHNAYFMQLAGEVVKNTSRMHYVDFLSGAFDHQEEFLTGAVDLTEPEVKDKIAVFTEGCCNVPKHTVLTGFDDPVITTRSRTAWKYAAHRGITGTPQFIINGVHVPDAADFKFADWKKLIDDLMATQ